MHRPDIGPLESTIVPIFLTRDSEPEAFCGTGFLLERGVFVTAWHGVRHPLAPGEGFIGAARIEGQFVGWALHGLERDRNGSDLALAHVDASPGWPLVLSDEGRLIGDDVWTYGYPFTTPRRESDGMHFTLHGSMLRGYATRTFDFDHHLFGKVTSYELDMPAPAGVSGAPLILEGTQEVIGAIYGSHQVQACEDNCDAPERVSMCSVTFGLAHRSKTLRAARTAVTHDKALADYLVR